MKFLAALGAILFLALPAVAVAQEEAPPPSDVPSPPAGGPPVLGASAAILVNLRNGEVIYEKQAHTQLPPASTTKIVTAMVVMDQYSLDETVIVAPEVAAVRGSRLGLETGMRFSVRDLLSTMLVKSANDAAAALSAHDPAGQAHFVAAMNSKARSLGAFETNFMNPHGMDEALHVSSAWDMAIFGRQLLADPVLAQIVALKSYALAWPDGTTRRFSNHNKLLSRYSDAIGIKTGYTNKAGRCLVGAARTPAGEALSVVMNSPDHYTESIALLDYFASRPALLRPVEEGSADTVELATPPPAPKVVARPVAVARPIATGGISMWTFIVAGLGLLTVLTFFFGRGRGLIAEASEHHAFLEPYSDD